MAAEAEETASFWQYFRSPFPKAEGFSAYRMPGLLVHVPVIFFFVWLGAWLCFGGDTWLSPLFILHLVMGIYIGRDVAILAHYNGLILIAVVAGWFILISYPPMLPHPTPLVGATATAALAIIFAIYVSWRTDLEPDRTRQEQSGRFPVLQRFIDRMDNAAMQVDDPAPVRLRKTLLIFLSTAGIIIAPLGARYLSSLQLPLAVDAALGFALLSVIALLHLLITRRESVAVWLLLSGLLFVPFVIQLQMGGFAVSGALVLWSLLAPLCALVFLSTRWAVLWFGAYTLLVLATAANELASGADGQMVLLFCENILLVSCIAFIALRFFIIERDRALAALTHEQERSEQLLLNILPASIAARLKDERKTLADGYSEVTILFADIVGFTKMSATINPERLVEILNKLFSRFDMLCDRHGVEKIKTIGDAYMVCAGLPVPRPDHAEAIAEMALAMRIALEEHNREFDSDLKIRIGINTGPVVAGVIGLKKFIYDLWGDTVNLASRMESHGVADGIQVSTATRAKLGERYAFAPRGTLDVKGIGLVEAWLLTGKKQR